MSQQNTLILSELGIDLKAPNSGCLHATQTASGKVVSNVSPTTNETLAQVQHASSEDLKKAFIQLEAAHKILSILPAPKRGEILRQIGVELRKYKTQLGFLVSLEMGKIKTEGLGEVQEAIDILDYACGLSRNLCGKVIPSERPGHLMLEQYNPIGPIGVITAFNFPLAVFFWNFAIAFACGDVVCWKPASSTALVAIACTKVVHTVLKNNNLSPACATLVVGSGSVIGAQILVNPIFKLFSFTGSTKVGTGVSLEAAKRFIPTILELGGNNAAIIMPDADLETCLNSCVFNALGTAGQRCTSLRRLYLHESIYDSFLAKLKATYEKIPLGDPTDETVLMGPLHTKAAVQEYLDGVAEIQKQGGKIVTGGKTVSLKGHCKTGNFVLPCIVETTQNLPILQEELFVPILHVLKFSTLEQAIEYNNAVPQGLSSSLYTNDIRSINTWIGPNGSDCGLVNVNTSTSGAEIGGQFGGNKATGGGRESGSDAWKQYCRLSTCVINASGSIPLAQGVEFSTTSTSS